MRVFISIIPKFQFLLLFKTGITEYSGIIIHLLNSATPVIIRRLICSGFMMMKDRKEGYQLNILISELPGLTTGKGSQRSILRTLKQ